MIKESKMQRYIDEYIKSIAVWKSGDKFYGTLTDKEGRTFEFSKEVGDIEKHLNNTHKAFLKEADIKDTMLQKCFQKLFVCIYASRRALGRGKTYDVVFNSDTDSNAKGFRSTIQECKDWIDLNRGRKETYFGDYAGGTVSIICNEDNETVYEEDIL